MSFLDKIRTPVTVIAASLLLTSCGFQLAGTTPSSVELYVENRVSIQQLIDQPVSEQILEDLGRSGATVRGKASNGMPGLVILNEENTERGLSLATGLFNRQIELEKRVHYQILDAAGNILITDSIRARRELIDDPATPAAKQQERELLMRAINRDISRQLIRLFNAVLDQQ